MLNAFFILTQDSRGENKSFEGLASLKDGISLKQIKSILSTTALESPVGHSTKFVKITNVFPTTKHVWSLKKGCVIVNGDDEMWIIPPLYNSSFRNKEELLKVGGWKRGSKVYGFDISFSSQIPPLASQSLAKGSKRFKKVAKSLAHDLLHDLVIGSILPFLLYEVTDATDQIKDVYGYFRDDDKRKIYQVWRSIHISFHERAFQLMCHKSTTFLRLSGVVIVPPSKKAKGSELEKRLEQFIKRIEKEEEGLEEWEIEERLDKSKERKELSKKYGLIEGSSHIIPHTFLYQHKFLKKLDLDSCIVLSRQFRYKDIGDEMKRVNLHINELDHSAFDSFSSLRELYLNDFGDKHSYETRMPILFRMVRRNLEVLFLDGSFETIAPKPPINPVEPPTFYLEYYEDPVFRPRINLIMIEDGISYLTKLKKLTAFSVDSLNDGAFRKLTSLERLELKWCNNVTGRSFEYLKEIKVLILVDCKSIVDKALSNHSNLHLLNIKSLSGVKGIELRTLKRLVELTVVRCETFRPSYVRTVPHIIYLKYDERLSLADEKMNCNILSTLKKLKYLELRDSITTGRFLRNLKELERVHLINCNEISNERFIGVNWIKELTLKGDWMKKITTPLFEYQELNFVRSLTINQKYITVLTMRYLRKLKIFHDFMGENLDEYAKSWGIITNIDQLIRRVDFLNMGISMDQLTNLNELFLYNPYKKNAIYINTIRQIPYLEILHLDGYLCSTNTLLRMKSLKEFRYIVHTNYMGIIKYYVESRKGDAVKDKINSMQYFETFPDKFKELEFKVMK